MALANGFDLMQIDKDQNPSFFTERGVMEGVARRFVEDIREWSNNYESLFWFFMKRCISTIAFTFPICHFYTPIMPVEWATLLDFFYLTGIEIKENTKSENTAYSTAENIAPLTALSDIG